MEAASREESVSISVPEILTDDQERINSPIRIPSMTRSIQTGDQMQTQMMSTGPSLYVSQKHVSTPLAQGSLSHRASAAANLERYPSHRKTDDNSSRRNEKFSWYERLGICDDPCCTVCGSRLKEQQKISRKPDISDAKFHNVFCGETEGCIRRFYAFVRPFISGVMCPRSKVIQQWNKIFVMSCLVAIFFDPLFFFPLFTIKENKCIAINWRMTLIVMVCRSVTDFIYIIHILIQFKLAYVVPESIVVGAGDLVDDPRKIARNYLSRYFILDVFVALPLPQIIILVIVPCFGESSGANLVRNLLQVAILLQYIPRLCRVLPFVAGLSSTGLVFESVWANFIINLLSFVLAGHVVGSIWYLLGLQRVNQCLRLACRDSNLTNSNCLDFTDCGHGSDYNKTWNSSLWAQWRSNENATACFGLDSFHYGIYERAVDLTTEQNVATKYIYSFFWGFQQISTLAGNQVPSYFAGEVVFTMCIVGAGLLLFALLIGNIQNVLQTLGNRVLAMSLRCRDLKKWMRYRNLSNRLKSKVCKREHHNFSARVNEEQLLGSLPEDLQEEIRLRLHLYASIKNVQIAEALKNPKIMDAVCERIRRETYVKGTEVLQQDAAIDKMVLIIRGKMESIGKDQRKVLLSAGEVCGEELLTSCLDHSSVEDGTKLLSKRLVRCLETVEAFVLRATDIEELTLLYAELRNPHVQASMRYRSYFRGLAAKIIKVAWRCKKKRQNRRDPGPTR